VRLFGLQPLLALLPERALADQFVQERSCFFPEAILLVRAERLPA